MRPCPHHWASGRPIRSCAGIRLRISWNLASAIFALPGHSLAFFAEDVVKPTHPPPERGSNSPFFLNFWYIHQQVRIMNTTLFLERLSRPYWIIMGLVIGANAVLYLSEKPLDTRHILLGGLMAGLGLWYGVYAFLGFSNTAKLAPRIHITDEVVELKPDLWHRTQQVHWADIQRIVMGPYELAFQLPDETKTVTYRTSAKRSRQLKQLIQAAAASKQVEVLGG